MSSRPLRWGVLGAAWIARRALLPAIRACGDELVALASSRPESGRELARDFEIPYFFERYEAVLEIPLDAVYIPLPNSLHRPWALQAIAQGKHVLCEKPLALSAAEAAEMGQAAARRGLVLAEAVMYRYHPRWQLLRRTLAQGRIGRLRHLQGSFTFPLADGPNPRWIAELGGGALYDVGCYLVNASRWLAGEPELVLARQSCRHGVDSDTSILLQFPSSLGPVSAELVCGFDAAESQQLLLVGSEATLRVPKPFTAWTAEEIPLWLSTAPGGMEQELPTPAADPYQLMVEAFGRSVREGRPVATGARDAEANLRVLDACRRSAPTTSWERP
ncbi:MAG: Gfo/Idh/MocA family protein [Candidatus Dormibacteria bacterium]